MAGLPGSLVELPVCFACPGIGSWPRPISRDPEMGQGIGEVGGATAIVQSRLEALWSLKPKLGSAGEN
jgi:hypothetical protein